MLRTGAEGRREWVCEKLGEFSSRCRVRTLQRYDIEIVISEYFCIENERVELVADIPIGISAFCFLKAIGYF